MGPVPPCPEVGEQSRDGDRGRGPGTARHGRGDGGCSKCTPGIGAPRCSPSCSMGECLILCLPLLGHHMVVTPEASHGVFIRP